MEKKNEWELKYEAQADERAKELTKNKWHFTITGLTTFFSIVAVAIVFSAMFFKCEEVKQNSKYRSDILEKEKVIKQIQSKHKSDSLEWEKEKEYIRQGFVKKYGLNLNSVYWEKTGSSKE